MLALLQKSIKTNDGKINIPKELKNVYIDIGLSWNAPQSVLWCQNVDNIAIFGFEPSPYAVSSINNIQQTGNPLPGSKIGQYLGPVVTKENQEFYLIQCALSDKNGLCTFYQTVNDVGTSSLYEPKNLGVFNKVIVDVYTLKDFFNVFPWDTHPYISYIKIDAQGSDLSILKGAGGYLSDKVVYVTAEGHGCQYNLADENSDENIIKYMDSIGFIRLKHNNTSDPTFLNIKYYHLRDVYINQIH
jgi:FkbM family methyltransferase